VQILIRLETRHEDIDPQLRRCSALTVAGLAQAQATAAGSHARQSGLARAAVVARPGLGVAWVLNRGAEPDVVLRSCAGASLTNIAFGGLDRKTLH
jgi:hypothetical protein